MRHLGGLGSAGEEAPSQRSLGSSGLTSDSSEQEPVSEGRQQISRRSKGLAFSRL